MGDAGRRFMLGNTTLLPVGISVFLPACPVTKSAVHEYQQAISFLAPQLNS
ncbi:MAG: hypothetical protein ACTS8H_04685 [Arsenophonus sp. NC-PE1-MAG3]